MVITMSIVNVDDAVSDDDDDDDDDDEDHDADDGW